MKYCISTIITHRLYISNPFFQGFFLKIYVFMYGLYPRVGYDGGMFHDQCSLNLKNIMNKDFLKYYNPVCAMCMMW